jgi:hypothetical protein
MGQVASWSNHGAIIYDVVVGVCPNRVRIQTEEVKMVAVVLLGAPRRTCVLRSSA